MTKLAQIEKISMGEEAKRRLGERLKNELRERPTQTWYRVTRSKPFKIAVSFTLAVVLVLSVALPVGLANNGNIIDQQPLRTYLIQFSESEYPIDDISLKFTFIGYSFPETEVDVIILIKDVTDPLHREIGWSGKVISSVYSEDEQTKTETLKSLADMPPTFFGEDRTLLAASQRQVMLLDGYTMQISLPQELFSVEKHDVGDESFGVTNLLYVFPLWCAWNEDGSLKEFGDCSATPIEYERSGETVRFISMETNRTVSIGD